MSPRGPPPRAAPLRSAAAPEGHQSRRWMHPVLSRCGPSGRRVGASAIVSVSFSGAATRAVARHLPVQPLAAVSLSQRFVNQIALCWGVHRCSAPTAARRSTKRTTLFWLMGSPSVVGSLQSRPVCRPTSRARPTSSMRTCSSGLQETRHVRAVAQLPRSGQVVGIPSGKPESDVSACRGSARGIAGH